MASFNKVTLVGNVGRDGELKYLQTGTAILEFSLAVQDGFGDKAQTMWFDCKQFGERAERVAEYIRKGGQVLVEGRLSNRSWEKDGVKHYKTDIVANDIVLLGSKPRDGAEGSANRSSAPAPARTRQAPRQQQTPPFGEDEELPF